MTIRLLAIAVRLVLLVTGSLFLAVEAFDLYGSARAQGWISWIGFILIIAAGWFLVANHSLWVVVFAFFLIPIGALWLIPIVSQLGFVILIVLGIRWVVINLLRLLRWTRSRLVGS